MKIAAVFCRGCRATLADENWYPSLRKTNVAWCSDCYQAKSKRLYCPICGIECSKERCLECHKKKHCRKCGVELIDENWYEAFRKRNVGRCKDCHDKVARAWDDRNPEDAAKRSARWRDRNPEYSKEYYLETVEIHAERARRLLWEYKIKALTMLGGQCVVCGITDMRILQINHINGGGVQESLFGYEMYRAIVNQTRKIDDLDVRCANHNLLYEYERGKRVLPKGMTP